MTRGGRTRRRPPAAIIVATIVLSLQVALLIFLGIGALFLLGLLGSSPAPDFTAGGTLTSSGSLLLVSGFALAYAALGIAVIVGLILRWRWAWAAAMTWAALSLVLGLVYYLRGSLST